MAQSGAAVAALASGRGLASGAGARTEGDQFMMRFMSSKVGLSSVVLAGWLLAPGVHAAGKGAKDKPAAAVELAETPEEPEDAKPSKEAAPTEEAEAAPEKAAAAPEAEGSDSPVEESGKAYRFVGARYRGIIVPKFIQNLFAEGGRTVYVHAFGPEFAVRKDGFEYNLSAWLGLYNMDDTGFKGSSDPEPAWEIINARMQILYLTSDFLWSHDFSPEVALNYGVGAGFGIVFGDLHRNQSYPTVPGQDPSSYAKCDAAGVPAVFSGSTPYCDSKNDHYGSYTEPSWANGGSKPLLFPWLALQTGLRFKPTRTFAGRLDLGFGTSGFFFGLGGDYGL
jgi:hypothetical protein